MVSHILFCLQPCQFLEKRDLKCERKLSILSIKHVNPSRIFSTSLSFAFFFYHACYSHLRLCLIPPHIRGIHSEIIYDLKHIRDKEGNIKLSNLLVVMFGNNTKRDYQQRGHKVNWP